MKIKPNEIVDGSANTLPECDDCSIVRGGQDCLRAECDRARTVEGEYYDFISSTRESELENLNNRNF